MSGRSFYPPMIWAGIQGARPEKMRLQQRIVARIWTATGAVQTGIGLLSAMASIVMAEDTVSRSIFEISR